MKLSEAILEADALRPNAVLPELKVRWLWGLEAEIAEMMGVELPELKPDDDPELLMPDPRSNIYPLWLCPYIDFAQEEFDKYSADLIIANTTLAEAKKNWIRNNQQECATKITGVFY